MRDPWDKPGLGTYPICVLLIALAGAMIGMAALAFGLGAVDVITATIALTAAAIAAFTLFYIIVRLIIRWLRRAHTDRIIIGHIASLVRQKLPLAQGLVLAAASERGVARRHLERVAEPLAVGFSLAESIRIGWPECPGLVLSLILAGERTGQLALAVEQAEQYLTERSRGHAGVNDPVIPYALPVVCLTVLVTTGMMVIVIPKFKEIFADFGARMPPSTLLVIDVALWFSQEGWPFLVLLGMLACIGIYLSLRPRRVPTPLLSSCIADWVRWHTPGLRRLEWSRGLAAGLRAMRMGLHAGLGLPASAKLASELDVNTELRSRLERFAELTEEGCDPREAADRAALGPVAGLALAAGSRGHDMDAAIRYAADYYDALISRWWLVFRSLAWPVTTLALGILVAFVVRGLFVPLVALLDQVMRYVQ